MRGYNYKLLEECCRWLAAGKPRRGWDRRRMRRGLRRLKAFRRDRDGVTRKRRTRSC